MFLNWLYKTFIASDIDFSVYTHIDYAFALVNNGSIPFFFDDWYATGAPYTKLVNGASFYGHARALLVKNGPTIQYNPAEM
jgi:hypothetical protein